MPENTAAITQWTSPTGMLLRQLADAEGDPLFVAKDVCEALGLTNSRVALQTLDDDEKAGVSLTYGSSNGTKQRRKTSVITEPGLYKLISRSRKPAAKVFDRWVRHEVLPQIRKTGAYSSEKAPAVSDMASIVTQAVHSALSQPAREVFVNADEVLVLKSKARAQGTVTAVWHAVRSRWGLRAGPAFKSVPIQNYEPILASLDEALALRPPKQLTTPVTRIHGFEMRDADRDNDLSTNQVQVKLEHDLKRGPAYFSRCPWTLVYDAADLKPLPLPGTKSTDQGKGKRALYLDENRYKHLLSWCKTHTSTMAAIIEGARSTEAVEDLISKRQKAR